MEKVFRTVYDRVRCRSNVGSPFANDYALKYDKDGRSHLEVVGKHDLQKEIQSYRDVCSVKSIVERYLNIGDDSLLNRSPVFYGDVTQMPDNYAELLQFTADARRSFDLLDSDIKAQFDNNVEMFIASIGTEKFNNVFFAPKENEVPLEPIKEVKSDE